jgi:hypothetical protein
MLKDMVETDPIPEITTVPALQYKLQFRKLLNSIAVVVDVVDVEQTSNAISLEATNDIISSFQVEQPVFELNEPLTLDMLAHSTTNSQILQNKSLFSDASSTTSVESSGSNPNKVNLDFGSEASTNTTLSSQELANAEGNLGLQNAWPRKFVFPLNELKSKLVKKLSDPEKFLSNKDENKIVKILFEKMRSYEM